MQILKRNLANLVTLVRLMGTMALIGLPPLSVPFYVIYSVCGVSDVADGFIARKLGLQSSFGAKLDSAADLLFYLVMLVKVFEGLFRVLPVCIWYVVGAVCLIRLADYGYAAVKFRRFAAMHTMLNKLTGFLLFLVPYLMEQGDVFTVYAFGICAVSAIAAIQELVLHIRLKPEETAKA